MSALRCFETGGLRGRMCTAKPCGDGVGAVFNNGCGEKRGVGHLTGEFFFVILHPQNLITPIWKKTPY